MINQAKAAQAGVELMMEIIGHINTRRPDMIAQACEKVLGLKATVGDDVFNAAMDKRVEAVTAFDPITARIAELEAALDEIRTLSQTPLLNTGKLAQSARFDITAVCREVLK